MCGLPSFAAYGPPSPSQYGITSESRPRSRCAPMNVDGASCESRMTIVLMILFVAVSTRLTRVGPLYEQPLVDPGQIGAHSSFQSSQFLVDERTRIHKTRARSL